MISPKMSHCLLFDIGKTNKKAFVFDENYRIVWKKTAQLSETTDDDGDPCDDIFLLKNWVLETVTEIGRDPRFQIRAANCATYGASFVHLDAGLQPVAPLYNYLKPFPKDLLDWFLNQYGGAEKLSLETASPLLGHLNSGLQLLWLKHRKPMIFNKIKWSLHLPQWVARVISEGLEAPPPAFAPAAEMTSLGCHTMLWDFQKNDYHDWAKAEGIAQKFPPIHPLSFVAPHAGVGLHDSSAALIPYLASFREPFVLISTGTWCISLNPFNAAPLTAAELSQDCLCYLTPAGKPVKAARYFGGHEHDEAVRRLAAEHSVPPDFFQKKPHEEGAAVFEKYAAFMRQLVEKQAASTRLAIGESAVRRIFVDGGFSKNELYMRLLAAHFPEMEVFSAKVPQASALGAAMAMHSAWNGGPMPRLSVTVPATGGSIPPSGAYFSHRFRRWP
jgi:sugar (pentulose or hexulose) kinase